MVKSPKLKRNTINLYDVLPLLKVGKQANKDKSELINQYMDLRDKFVNLYNSANGLIESKLLSTVLLEANSKNKFIDKMDDIRKRFLSDYGYLPDDLKNGYAINDYHGSLKTTTDDFTTLSTSAVIKGIDVKAIADKFNFIAIPFECLNKKSYEKESYIIKKQIENFNSQASKNFDVYVITPIEYYSVENHVYNNITEKPIYSGMHFQTLSSVMMNIPMFRSILNTIANMGDKVNTLSSEMTSVKTTIDQMENNLKMLQRQVDKQHEMLIKQQIQINEQASEMAKFEEMMLRIIDPVMIAVKKGVDINTDEFDESVCFVGPCWGPDFDEAVSMALDIKVLKNQRNTLNKTAEALWN